MFVCCNGIRISVSQSSIGELCLKAPPVMHVDVVFFLRWIRARRAVPGSSMSKPIETAAPRIFFLDSATRNQICVRKATGVANWQRACWQLGMRRTNGPACACSLPHCASVVGPAGHTVARA